MGEIRTSSAHLAVESTNLYSRNCNPLNHVLYKDCVSYEVHIIITVKIMSMFRMTHDWLTKRDGSSFKSLVVQQISRNINVAKYK